MFSAASTYPVLIASHLIVALLVTLIFRKKNDASARLWVSASLMFCLALGILLSFDETSPFIRYFLGNFFALCATILYGYSLTRLFGLSYKTTDLDLVMCGLGASVFFLLVKLELSIFVDPAAGLIYGLLNLYIFLRLKRINKDKNLYFKIISYTFLALAMIWFARIPLSRTFEFKFAVDSGLPNYLLVFTTLILLLFRQVGYLVLRIDLMLSEKIDNATDFAAAVQTQMLKSLNALSLARDHETGNHIVRTQWYVKEVALKLLADGHYAEQLNEKVIDAMFMVAPLHDIGKVGIPDSVLLKPDALDAAEWSIMKTHATIGETILQAAIEGDRKHAQLLQTAIEIAGGHHEKWNGTGYPRGLSGQQIPLAARIMSVADIYDALVSARVYKITWPHERAIEEIKRYSGEYFDPVVVEAFLSIQDRVKAIATAHADAE